MTTLFRTSLIGLALAGTTALPSLAADISWIYCGDRIDPAHEKYIAEWNAANPDYPVVPEVVGWAQCQDKATTLAAAGSPAGMAYVGSRTLKEFALSDLIVEVPMTDEEKAAYYPNIVDTVTFEGTQWGVPIAFDQGALLEQGPVRGSRPRSREAADHLGRGNRIRQDHQGKDRQGRLWSARQDLRQYHAPVPALGLHQ